jgi:predicted site-specific integrase-resolvase
MPRARPNQRRAGLNTSEVAGLFNVTRATLYRWMRDGKITGPTPDPDTGQKLWRQMDLDAVAQFIRTREEINGQADNR